MSSTPAESTETKMVNKPQTTQMIAKKKVKILTQRPISVDGKIVEPGQTLEVSEDEAKEFCDRSFQSFYPFSGERYEDATPAKIFRAVRV